MIIFLGSKLSSRNNLLRESFATKKKKFENIENKKSSIKMLKTEKPYLFFKKGTTRTTQHF
jgi:hypothetical protein